MNIFSRPDLSIIAAICLTGMIPFLPADAGSLQGHANHAPLELAIHGREHVVLYRHILEQANVLERARDAGAGDDFGGAAGAAPDGERAGRASGDAA